MSPRYASRTSRSVLKQMASCKIVWKSSAERELRGIDKRYIQRIVEAVEALSTNPYSLQVKKLYGAESLYRIRIGDYRVIYHLDVENAAVTIQHVRHRKDAYRG